MKQLKKNKVRLDDLTWSEYPTETPKSQIKLKNGWGLDLILMGSDNDGFKREEGFLAAPLILKEFTSYFNTFGINYFPSHSNMNDDIVFSGEAIEEHFLLTVDAENVTDFSGARDGQVHIYTRCVHFAPYLKKIVVCLNCEW